MQRTSVMARESIISLCRRLPEKLAASFYYRLLKGKVVVEGHEAKLRYAPRCRIRLPKSNDFMYEAIFCTGGFEGEVSRIVRRTARAGGLLCDVGANIGYFSLIWLSAATDTQAVLVEADPRLAVLARENIARNSYDSRVSVHACAAGVESGYMGLRVYGDKVTGWAHLTQSFGYASMRVRVASLDTLMHGRAVTFLKVDVEGAEPLVFRGARTVLASPSLKAVVFESNEPGSAALHVDPAESHQILQEFGFHLTRLGEDKSIVNWLAVR